MEAFPATAFVQDFEVLGSNSAMYATPFNVGNDTYQADANILASSSKFGEAIGRPGVAISNNPELSMAHIGFVEIVFGTPALRAGAFVGAQFPWRVDVQFFDGKDRLLGSIPLAGDGGENSFAGWQADDGPIMRLRIVDVINNESNIIVDDVIREIPEPSSMCCGLVGVFTCLQTSYRRGVRRE